MTENEMTEIPAQLRMMILGLRSIIEEQANDPGLWLDAELASEDYLQKELRRLHHAVELLYNKTLELHNA